MSLFDAHVPTPHPFDTLPNPSDGSDVWEREDLIAHNIPAERTWTLVDSGDDDSQWAAAGYHWVNRFGYAVTKTPWREGELDVRWDE